MKTLTTWTPPVAISLLLHAALIALVSYRLSNTDTVKNQIQSITVELQSKSKTIENIASRPELTPLAIPVSQPGKTEPAAVEKPVQRDQITSIEPPKQTSTDNQMSSSAVFATQTVLNIQPLGKLTRQPAFLHKIDPVYPASEQRAGSQATVLAEATIDEKGEVVVVKILKSAGAAFDNAVRDALGKSLFAPGFIDTEAVAVRVLVPFRFNLK